MAKKKRKPLDQSRKPAEAPAPEPPPEAEAQGVRWRLVFHEVLHEPTLIAAWVATVVTLFAIYGAFRFANDVSMGAMREPTGIIFCGAIAFTLFASYWRQARRGDGDDASR